MTVTVVDVDKTRPQITLFLVKMAVYDEDHKGYRVFVGDLGTKVFKYELEKEFEYYGEVKDVWLAR